jgi:hypothetical protein
VNDDHLKAKSDYDAAKRRLSLCTPNDKVAEQMFSLAYQRLVVLGLAQPIKRKYRS